MSRTIRILLRIALFAGIVAADPPRSLASSISPLSLFPAMAPTTILKDGCPRREDIHPCECLEIPKLIAEGPDEIETVVFCKTIRNSQVLQNAMKGMQGHIIDFMVLDSCKLPPFPNGLFFNIGIKWMEILNSTVQFKTNFFQCANNCWWTPIWIPFFFLFLNYKRNGAGLWKLFFLLLFLFVELGIISHLHMK